MITTVKHEKIRIEQGDNFYKKYKNGNLIEESSCVNGIQKFMKYDEDNGNLIFSKISKLQQDGTTVTTIEKKSNIDDFGEKIVESKESILSDIRRILEKIHEIYKRRF